MDLKLKRVQRSKFRLCLLMLVLMMKVKEVGYPPFERNFSGCSQEKGEQALSVSISHDQNFNLSPSLSYGCEMHFTFFWPRVRFV